MALYGAKCINQTPNSKISIDDQFYVSAGYFTGKNKYKKYDGDGYFAIQIKNDVSGQQAELRLTRSGRYEQWLGTTVIDR